MIMIGIKCDHEFHIKVYSGFINTNSMYTTRCVIQYFHQPCRPCDNI